MNFDLTDEQELYKATAEKFFSTLSISEKVSMRMSSKGYDSGRWEKLAELGMIMLAASEDNGGLGGSLTDLAAIAEAAGTQNAADPWLENGVLPARVLDKAGAQPLLTELLSGTKITALAFSEANSRYNLERIDTSAKKTSSGFELSGTKQFVLGGDIADHFLVTAMIDDTFDVFLVPADAVGVHSTPYRVVDGSKAVEALFTNVALPSDARLNLSFEAFKTVVSEISLLACAEMMGLSQLLLDDTVEYVKQRKQFGVSIGSFQVIQHGLVDCYAELEQIRSMFLRTLLDPAEHKAERLRNISGAKAFISERADFIGRNAVQYFGAMGITEDVPIGSALKRIMLLSRLFGDPSHCLDEYSKVA